MLSVLLSILPRLRRPSGWQAVGALLLLQALPLHAATYSVGADQSYRNISAGRYEGAFDLSELAAQADAAAGQSIDILSASLSLTGYSPQDKDRYQQGWFCVGPFVCITRYVRDDRTKDTLSLSAPTLDLWTETGTEDFGFAPLVSGRLDPEMLQAVVNAGSALSYTLTVAGDMFRSVSVALNVDYGITQAPSEPSVVPLPPAGLALAGGLLALAGLRRRKRKA